MILLFIFLLGTCVGSFLQVVTERLPKGKTVLFGRSRCDSCKKTLSFLDLIPLLSFIILRGKCRYCENTIDVQHFSVELITGVMFVVTTISSQFTVYSSQSILSLVYYLFVTSALIAIFFIDLKYGVIPDEIIYTLIAISTIYLIITTQYLLLPNIVSAIFSFLFLYLIHIFSKGRGMGFGDVTFAFAMGLLLGFPRIIAAHYLAFLTGAFVSIILILLGKKKLKGSTIPFGPFLVIGTYISLFWGEKIIKILFKL